VKFESGNPSGFPDSYFLKDSKAVSAAEDQSVDETQVLDANDFEKLERRAKNMLLHQLSRSIKSTKQLRDYLTKREIPSPVIDAAIERFTEAGLIDDLRYAETFAASKRSTRGLSTSALRRELGAKGIPTGLIDEVLAEYSQEDDLKTAIRLAEKRIRGMGHLEREVRHRRLLGFLGRKGFSSSICFKAIKAAEQSLNQ
jgi:regulatory protein